MKKMRMSALAAVLAGVTMMAIPVAPAFAWGYGRNTVKQSAGDVDVHATAPNGSPSGPYIGSLQYPQSFSVEKTASNQFWCYGFAYGNVNQHGWVQCQQLMVN